MKETIKLKQKKYRQQTGTFLIEGERMLREAFKTPELLVRVFLEDDIPIPREINSLNIECFQVTSAIMKAMADTEHPQGVVAVARIPQHQPEYLFDRSLWYSAGSYRDPVSGTYSYWVGSGLGRIF